MTEQSVPAPMLWRRVLTRSGYAAVGTLYVIIAVVAARAAHDPRVAPADFSGAVAILGHGVAGMALGTAVCVGLAANAISLFARAWYNTDRVGSTLISHFLRATCFVSGIVYIYMAYLSIRLLAGRHPADAGGDGPAQAWTSAILARPAGQWAILAVGIGIVVYGIIELYRAWWAEFDGRLDLRILPKLPARAAVNMSRLGMVARAVVLLVAGGFLLLAAYSHHPGAARGLGGALGAIGARPGGRCLLATAAAGLFAYGLHNYLLAVFRRFQPRRHSAA